ncbi:MAG TPA: ATP-binding protein [Candidatus Angelobacter sp.]|nr:ATP-binding protein [Candidatus Angelobacter sp.]
MATSLQSQTAPACPVCDGTGWKSVAVPGKASRVTRCDCRIASRNQLLLEQAQIPARYKDCTLESFRLEHVSLSVRNAHRDAQRFVQEYPLERKGLLLIGSIGVGKTHLAVGIIQGLIREKGVPSLFCDYRELLKEIQNSYNPAVQATELQILRPVLETEVLLLDELGAIKSSEWVWDTVSYILNSRYNEQKTTIITTNFPDSPSAAAAKEPQSRLGGKSREEENARTAAREETLGDRITDRMRSRLHEMCRVRTLKGSDYRTSHRD